RGPIKAGSTGPMVGDFAFVRITEVRHGVPGARVWLIIRRNVADPTAVTLYLSTAPDAIDLTVLVRMGGLRWPIELPVEASTGEVGMAHAETRSWRGWQHQMVVVLLAHHCLVWRRGPWHDRAPALTRYQVRLVLIRVLAK